MAWQVTDRRVATTIFAVGLVVVNIAGIFAHGVAQQVLETGVFVIIGAYVTMVVWHRPSRSGD